MSEAHRDVRLESALEPCGSPDHADCGLRLILDRLGEQWTVMVLAELSSGPRRYRQLERALVVARNIEQLELALEGLEVARAAIDTRADEDATAAPPHNTSAPRRRGKPVLSEHVVAGRRTLDPGSQCPDCGGELRLVGEDVSEILDLVAAQLKKIEIARPKKSCRHCEAMVQTPAPTRSVARGMAGPGLLAHILVSK